MKLKIENQRIEIIETELFVSNTVNVYRVTFEFDESWDGYQPVAVFECRDGRHTEAREVIIVDNSAIIPWETLLPGGTLRIGVYGTRDGQRLPTVYTPGQYVSRGAEGAEEGTEATPGALEQVLNTIGDLSDLETEDKTTLVNAINEAAESGGGGTGDHDKLKNRDAADQHPMSSITGLEKALEDKQPSGDYLTGDELDSAVDDALAKAKASGDFDGAPGKDGTNGADGTPGKDGAPGKDGTSVTVQTVTESMEDGGSNVVTFSDGKNLTVKNGKTGGTGPAGATPKKGVDYYTEADKQEITSGVIAQIEEQGEYVTRTEFDAALGAYIADIDTLIGGDA